jgi:hypothetical protein
MVVPSVGELGLDVDNFIMSSETEEDLSLGDVQLPISDSSETDILLEK